jgi:hypothetical protein
MRQNRAETRLALMEYEDSLVETDEERELMVKQMMENEWEIESKVGYALMRKEKIAREKFIMNYFKDVSLSEACLVCEMKRTKDCELFSFPFICDYAGLRIGRNFANYQLMEQFPSIIDEDLKIIYIKKSGEVLLSARNLSLEGMEKITW